MDCTPVSCYLCGAAEHTPWGAEHGFTMVRCAGCGLVYLNPRPPEDAIDEAARTGLHKFGAGMLNAVGSYSTKKVADCRAKLEHLFEEEPLSGRAVRWLDVGAGFGELLEAARHLAGPGSDVLGIDPCAPKVDKGRARGLPVETTPLSEVEGTFDIISLINVYSHLPDPVEFLRTLRGKLREQGTVVLVTGNGADVARDRFPGSLYLPDHLSFAGEKHLHTVFVRAGFEVAHLDKYPALPSLDSPPVTALKNVARKLTGRPTAPLFFPKDSAYRALWIRARLL